MAACASRLLCTPSGIHTPSMMSVVTLAKDVSMAGNVIQTAKIPPYASLFFSWSYKTFFPLQDPCLFLFYYSNQHRWQLASCGGRMTFSGSLSWLVTFSKQKLL